MKGISKKERQLLKPSGKGENGEKVWNLIGEMV